MERIIANSKRMLSLINNLLDEAQIEAGGLTLRNAAYSVTELIEEVHSTMRVLAEPKGLKLEMVIGDDVPREMVGDAQRLNQILINLVGNAIKFTQEGYVRISAIVKDSQNWSLQVSDTGPGIPKESQQLVFEPFRQVDDPITRKHVGSGLGLSIVKRLTALMGGEVTLTSEVGKGSTFEIILPLEPIKGDTTA